MDQGKLPFQFNLYVSHVVYVRVSDKHLPFKNKNLGTKAKSKHGFRANDVF